MFDEKNYIAPHIHNIDSAIGWDMLSNFAQGDIVMNSTHYKWNNWADEDYPDGIYVY